MSYDNQHIDNLIAKVLAGEATREQEQELLQWMETSDENKKYFADIRFVHDKAVASRKYHRVDVDKAWSQVKSQLKNDTSGMKEHKTLTIPFYKLKWVGIAASVILIVGLSVVFYLYHPSSSKISEKYIASGSSAVLKQTFSDNTQVVLNKNSSITYKTYRREKRKEIILSGEAYISVKHSEDTLLIVKAEETFIRDIGTAFNVKAYPDSSLIEVFVEHGEVAFYSGANPGIHLGKGETGVYNKELKTFSKLELANSNVLSYKTRLFLFKNTKLSDVVMALNAIYEEKIIIGNPDLYNCQITVTFDNENIMNIADIIAETLGLVVERTSIGYVLNGSQCSTKP